MENLTKDQGGEGQSSSNKKIKSPYTFEVHDFHISQTIGNDDKEKKVIIYESFATFFYKFFFLVKITIIIKNFY